jgi:molecular chaperone DnaK
MSLDRGALKRHALGVDFGTSYTAAVARRPDGHTRAILVDGSPLLPSAVYLEPDGSLIAGRDAVHSARLDPARYEPAPKRRIAGNQMPLGLPVVDLIAAVLDRIAEEWRRAVGTAPADVTLTCPAGWDAGRRQLLADAAGRAGLTDARLVAEPLAAAAYYTEVLGRDIAAGSAVVVHDLGAGTLDVSLVAHGADGLEVLAVDSRDDIGGLDVDAAIVGHLRSRLPEAVRQRLTEPATVAERRAQRQLCDDVRVAKERLSRSHAADLVLPLLDVEVRLTRAELETVAGPLLNEAVQVTKRLLDWADLPAEQLSGVFLIGGASRIPLLAALLERELGAAPVTVEQPELVVAEGGILAATPFRPGDPAAPAPPTQRHQPPPSPAAAETAVVAQPAVGETAVVDRPSAETAVVSRPGAAETAVVRHSEDSDSERAPAGSLPSPAPTGASAGPFGAAGRNDIPSAADGADPPMRPPVDPWPHAEARLPDPDETVADDGIWRPANSPPRSGPAPAPPAAAGRDSRRNGSPSRGTAARPAPPESGKRRPGRFLRFLEVLLSIIVLITVPLAAMVLAYSYGTGEPFRDAALELARDLRDLIRTNVFQAG